MSHVSPLPDADTQRPYEEGQPLPEAETTAGGLPPGGGRQVFPHFTSFNAIVNWGSRAYRYTYDEAVRHSHANALAIRRDPVVMDALRSRQIPTAQLSWHLETPKDADPKQAQAVSILTDIINEIPRFQALKMHLLEALWYGRYAVQVTYAWDYTTGTKRLVVRDHRPINGDKLVFRYSGECGVLVHSTYDKGPWSLTERGRAHFFSPEEREQILVHRHEPEDADFYESEMAGAVHGVGIRSRIYWLWWLRTQVTAWLMDYLERVGAGGLTIYYYEAGNRASQDEVQQAAEEQHRDNTILFPRPRTVEGAKSGAGVERIETGNGGAQQLQSLITGYFDDVIRRFILGQSLSSESNNTGLGSGVADLHADTLARIIKYDAVALQETMTTELVRPLAKYNTPWVRPETVRIVFDVDKPNVKDTLAAASAFYEMGGDIDADNLRSIIGLAKPEQGHAVLSKIPPMSPTAMGGVPQGVPFMGQPGPEGQPQEPPPGVL